LETQDPRSDIIEDHRLWADLLALCNRYGKEEPKIMMDALRRAECKLFISENKLCFAFNRQNLDDHLIKLAKEILSPHRVLLKSIFNKIATKHINLNPKDWKEEVPF